MRLSPGLLSWRRDLTLESTGQMGHAWETPRRYDQRVLKELGPKQKEYEASKFKRVVHIRESLRIHQKSIRKMLSQHETNYGFRRAVEGFQDSFVTGLQYLRGLEVIRYSPLNRRPDCSQFLGLTRCFAAPQLRSVVIRSMSTMDAAIHAAHRIHTKKFPSQAGWGAFGRGFRLCSAYRVR